MIDVSKHEPRRKSVFDYISVEYRYFVYKREVNLLRVIGSCLGEKLVA